jgi:hypothetical protein
MMKQTSIIAFILFMQSATLSGGGVWRGSTDVDSRSRWRAYPCG